MRRIFIITITSILGLSLSVPAIAGDKEDIETAMNDQITAYRNGDAEALDRLLTEPYSHINNGQKPVERSAYIGWIGSRKDKIKAGTVKVTKYDMSDLVITQYDKKTAVATGFAKIAGENDGKSWGIDFRFTNLWLKQDGKWKRAAFHDTYLRRD